MTATATIPAAAATSAATERVGDGVLGWGRRLVMVTTLACVACATSVADVRSAGQARDIDRLRAHWAEANRDRLRVAVIDALSRHAEAPDIIAEAMAHESDRVRAAAATAARHYEFAPMQAALLHCLGDAFGTVRASASSALADFGDKTRASLVTVLRSGTMQQARASAADLLAGLPNDGPTTKALIEQARRDEAAMVRRASARALGNIGDGDAQPVLRALANEDPDRTVRAVAERALQRLDSDPSREVIVAVYPIVDHTRGADPAIAQAVETLRERVALRMAQAKVCTVAASTMVGAAIQQQLAIGSALYDGDAPSAPAPGFVKIANQIVYGSIAADGSNVTISLNRIDVRTVTAIPGAAVVARGYTGELDALVDRAVDVFVRRFR